MHVFSSFFLEHVWSAALGQQIQGLLDNVSTYFDSELLARLGVGLSV